TTAATALEMAQGHQIVWKNSDNSVRAKLDADFLNLTSANIGPQSRTAGGANSFTVTQTAANVSDTGDTGLQVAYSLSASSATNELVTRVFNLGVTNNLTGGGHIQNMRAVDVVCSFNSGTTTDLAAALFVETGTTTGSVGTYYGLLINNVPIGTTA